MQDYDSQGIMTVTELLQEYTNYIINTKYYWFIKVV